MNDAHKIGKLKNRLKRLSKKYHDKKNPLNPRQSNRLNELRGMGLNDLINK